jgi:chemotaxis protein histidine kinase CheA
MANLLAYGFGIPKSERTVALSASEDVFVTIRGMAGRCETISSLTVESLLAESDSLLKESKAQVAIARDLDDEHAYEWEVAIELSDSHKQKKEEGLLLHTKLLAFVEARKSARFLVKRAEDDNDVRSIRDWYPVVKAANKVLALYDAEEIANEQKRTEAKRAKRSPPARRSADYTNKEDNSEVDEEEETDDDSTEDDERTDLEVPAAAKRKEGRKRKRKSGSSIAVHKADRDIGTMGDTKRVRDRKTPFTEGALLLKLKGSYIKFGVSYPNFLGETFTWTDNKVHCVACSKFVDFTQLAQHVHGNEKEIPSRHQKLVLSMKQSPPSDDI